MTHQSNTMGPTHGYRPVDRCSELRSRSKSCPTGRNAVVASLGRVVQLDGWATARAVRLAHSHALGGRRLLQPQLVRIQLDGQLGQRCLDPGGQPSRMRQGPGRGYLPAMLALCCRCPCCLGLLVRQLLSRRGRAACQPAKPLLDDMRRRCGCQPREVLRHAQFCLSC
jgi:hypothetical protein